MGRLSPAAGRMRRDLIASLSAMPLVQMCAIWSLTSYRPYPGSCELLPVRARPFASIMRAASTT
jgi:hypothetical protein